EQAGIVLENPATRRATTYIKNFEVPQNFDQALEPQQSSQPGVYVILTTLEGPGAQSPEDRFFDLQREQMEMMMQMDPDQLSQAMSHGMDLWMNMDPALRGQMMGQMMKAGMQMFN